MNSAVDVAPPVGRLSMRELLLAAPLTPSPLTRRYTSRISRVIYSPRRKFRGCTATRVRRAHPRETRGSTRREGRRIGGGERGGGGRERDPSLLLYYLDLRKVHFSAKRGEEISARSFPNSVEFYVFERYALKNRARSIRGLSLAHIMISSIKVAILRCNRRSLPRRGTRNIPWKCTSAENLRRVSYFPLSPPLNP